MKRRFDRDCWHLRALILIGEISLVSMVAIVAASGIVYSTEIAFEQLFAQPAFF